jgi:hypothetical protein
MANMFFCRRKVDTNPPPWMGAWNGPAMILISSGD